MVAAGGLLLLVSAFHQTTRLPVTSEEPTVAPTGDPLIAFVTPNGRIATVRLDGSGEHVLTTGEEGGAAASVGLENVLDQSPQWSIDGSTIYFVRVVRDTTWLCTVRADGSDFQVITRELDGGHIVVSPDGERIAYDGNDGALHVVGTDGSAVAIPAAHVDGPGWLMWGPNRPAWSPDGDRIAFAGPADGAGRCGNDGCALWVLDLDSGKLTNLTTDAPNQKVVSVVWAPNDRIVYASVDSSTESGPPLTLWSIDADGTGRHELPSDGKTVPVATSPDGSKFLVGRYLSFPYLDDRGLFIDDDGTFRPVVANALSSFGDWRP